jgi:hypothetical protein
MIRVYGKLKGWKKSDLLTGCLLKLSSIYHRSRNAWQLLHLSYFWAPPALRRNHRSRYTKLVRADTFFELGIGETPCKLVFVDHGKRA